MFGLGAINHALTAQPATGDDVEHQRFGKTCVALQAETVGDNVRQKQRLHLFGHLYHWPLRQREP
ncbi:hypothetical protein D3C71_2024810 [compost metagenome]